MKRLTCSVACLGLAFASQASALPFNDDMVDSHITSGQIMRPKPAGVIARGMGSRVFENKDAVVNLQNPVKANADSVLNGRRLFEANCSPCHGDISKPNHEHGPVAQPGKFLAPPDITSDFYKQKSDGYIFGAIHFGGQAIMPAYGWKFSNNEHWDIVNYVRSIQAKTK